MKVINPLTLSVPDEGNSNPLVYQLDLVSDCCLTPSE
jgi:hypothetical protein